MGSSKYAVSEEIVKQFFHWREFWGKAIYLWTYTMIASLFLAIMKKIYTIKTAYKFTNIELVYRFTSVIFSIVILRNSCTFTSFFSLKQFKIWMSVQFYYLQICLAKDISIWQKIVLARNLQTLCNIIPKPWSYISESRFLVVALQSWIVILGHVSWLSGFGSWVLDPGFWIMCSGYLALIKGWYIFGPKSRIPGLGPSVINSECYRKCDRQSFQSVEGIKKCGKKLLQKFDSY